MNELNNLWENTPKTEEFIGSIKIENNNITSFTLLAYKNIRNNSLNIVAFDKEFITATIHSHPYSTICGLSELDKTSYESIICVMCDKNKIRCFNNGQDK